jgi:hypothetical protein
MPLGMGSRPAEVQCSTCRVSDIDSQGRDATISIRVANFFQSPEPMRLGVDRARIRREWERIVL